MITISKYSNALKEFIFFEKYLKNANEPIGSLKSSYTPLEAVELISKEQIKDITIKPILAWMFVQFNKPLKNSFYVLKDLITEINKTKNNITLFLFFIGFLLWHNGNYPICKSSAY